MQSNKIQLGLLFLMYNENNTEWKLAVVYQEVLA
jgi:hypothetical protein